MSASKQKELVDLAKLYYGEKILPQLRFVLENDLEKIAVYICGSVASGFCDEHSDVDIDVYGPKLLLRAMRLITEIPNNDEYQGVHISFGLTHLAYRYEQIMSDRLNYDFWRNVHSHLLFDLSHLIPLHDPQNILPELQLRVSFYPDDIYKQAIRGLWLTVNDGGIYNAEQCLKRGLLVESEVSFWRGTEALLRLIYLLNRRYYPHSKWLMVGMDDFDNNSDLTIDALSLCQGGMNERIQKFSQYVEQVRQYMCERQIIEIESIDNAWNVLMARKPFLVPPATF